MKKIFNALRHPEYLQGGTSSGNNTGKRSRKRTTAECRRNEPMSFGERHVTCEEQEKFGMTDGVFRVTAGAFTLAEVLITLAIIGVVAALTIPSVISNSQQQEFKTGLRKAVSVLNSAITMNMAIDGESPYDNANLMGYLMKHMSIIESTSDIKGRFFVASDTATGGSANSAFYTTDGMRFEFRNGETNYYHPLYESGKGLCLKAVTGDYAVNNLVTCGGCGSLGLNSNTDNTTKVPCLITVDVNGDRKPNPDNIDCKKSACAKPYKYSDPSGKKLTDIFSIMITDKQAIPYGIPAQKAMYSAQK